MGPPIAHRPGFQPQLQCSRGEKPLYALPATGLLNGVKSGQQFGTMLNTVARNAGKINNYIINQLKNANTNNLYPNNGNGTT